MEDPSLLSPARYVEFITQLAGALQSMDTPSRSSLDRATLPGISTQDDWQALKDDGGLQNYTATWRGFSPYLVLPQFDEKGGRLKSVMMEFRMLNFPKLPSSNNLVTALRKDCGDQWERTGRSGARKATNGGLECIVQVDEDGQWSRVMLERKGTIRR